MPPVLAWDPGATWQTLTGDVLVRHALVAGTVTAVAGALVGWFVVLRGLEFVTDALTHVGFAGASGAVLLGVSPLAGLLVLTGATATGIGVLERRARDREVVTGLVLVQALGLGVLFLRLGRGEANAAYALLFGGILALDGRQVLALTVACGLAVLVVAATLRPLLLLSVDPELAEARGVPVRRLSLAFLGAVALAATAATQTVGALLAVVLIVAPAAAAHRLATRPGAGLVVSLALGIAVAWVGVVAAVVTGRPVGFTTTAAATAAWAASRFVGTRR